jgi:glycosyltransferase involved in cell wall biosynthesis
MTGALPFVTALTITYRQPERAIVTVRSLLEQDYPTDRFEVIVLDDGSDDDTGARLVELMHRHPVATVLIGCRHERHYMSAARWNRCVVAGSDHTSVFVQVDDVVARPDLIREHVKWHADDTLRVVTGAKFEGAAPTFELTACRRAALAVDGGPRRGIPASAVWGASLSYPAALCRAAGVGGPYDEQMEGWGFHEVELALRFEAMGAELVYDPACGVFHLVHTAAEESYRGLDRAAETPESSAVWRTSSTSTGSTSSPDGDQRSTRARATASAVIPASATAVSVGLHAVAVGITFGPAT